MEKKKGKLYSYLDNLCNGVWKTNDNEVKKEERKTVIQLQRKMVNKREG